MASVGETLDRPGPRLLVTTSIEGAAVAQVAADLDIGDQTIYNWCKQELIDTGQSPSLNRAEKAELAAANRRIRELETEVAILKRTRELLGRRSSARSDRLPTAVGV